MAQARGLSEDSLKFPLMSITMAVPLPPGFPASPAEACATLMICGHEIEIVLRDVDEARLLARMTGLLEAWDEGAEEDGEDDVN